MIPIVSPIHLLELELKKTKEALEAAENQARMNYLRWQSAETELKSLKGGRS
jgi:hypothetical protein